MNLFYKEKNDVFKVFDVTYDTTGYPQFLIFVDGEWKRISAKHFTPNFYEDGQGGTQHINVNKI